MTATTDMGGVLTLPLYRCDFIYDRSGAQCEGSQLETSRFCIMHAPADELDMASFHAKHVRAAKYVLAEGLPIAAETLVRLAGDPEAGSGANIKASSEVLDRAGVPRVAATVLQADITHRAGRTAAEIVQERLTGLMGRMAEDAEDDLPEPTIVDGTVTESDSPAET